MDQNIKKQWVEALRSGKYKQGRGCLRVRYKTIDKFCCLGVLCDLHAQATNCEWEGGIYLGKTSLLPEKVVKWAGLSSMNPHIGGKGVSFYNDEKWLNFDQMADLIESNL